VKLLLDTSVVLWSATEKRKLNSRAMELLNARSSVLYLSSASVWEIALKFARGNLPLHAEPAVLVPQMIEGLQLQPLPISYPHAIEAARLPRYHRDPFDRMLIAQAKAEDMILLTSDRILKKYDAEIVLCGR
jgi:PIN domain nuclease of toxin-antitoxin system